MRRKLIQKDAFDQIERNSATKAEQELAEAEHILAKALDKSPLALRCFNESTVVYETADNTYIHAGYEIKEGNLTLNNIEELIIEEKSRKEKQKATLANLIDAVLVDEGIKAQALFNDYLSEVQWSNGQPKRSKKLEEVSRNSQIMEAVQTIGGEIADAYIVAKNVLDYVDTMRHGPTVAEAITKKDDKGNVTHLRIPTNETRNVSRIQKFKWTTQNHETHGSRQSVPQLINNEEFCKTIANLKRMNAFSDQNALVECLDIIVQKYPQLLLTSQSELASIIGEALQIVGASNYDDQTCDFMSEAVLRHAHGAYTEKVNQILQLAGTKPITEGDAYTHFQGIAQAFFKHLDEQYGLERKAFADLYESCKSLWNEADRQGNKTLKREAAAYLNELADVLNGQVKPSLETAESTAKWLAQLIENNIQGASMDWNVSNKPHLTIVGDHPQMAQNAKVPAVPGAYTGDWGDEAPAIGQDNHNYKGGKNAGEMRNRSWGQEGGAEVFPKLKNPYVPKAGDFTMKPEKGVDKDNPILGGTGSDVWPALQNPYVPQEAGGEGGQKYKMKEKEMDLVVDR